MGQGRDGSGATTTRQPHDRREAWSTARAVCTQLALWPLRPIHSSPIPPAAQIHVQAVKSGGKFVETFFKASSWRRTGSSTCTAVPSWPALLPLL